MNQGCESQSLIGKKAPLFRAKAVVGGIIEEAFSLENFVGKYLFFFFYPLDFTFVCPTELHAFQERLADFHERGAEVIACSVDSVYAHLAWMREKKERGGIKGIEYPLVSDLTRTIATEYRVLKEEEGVAYRAQFLIDKQGIIRHQLVNDLPLGRSVDEALRLIDALIFHETHGNVCPANWMPGAKALTPTQEGIVSYFESGV